MNFSLQPVCNYSKVSNMAVPVGITALEWNNNVIQKHEQKHYLHNILLSYTKAVFITVSPHCWYLQKKEEQCNNNHNKKKIYYWKHQETKTPFKQVRKQIRGNHHTHTHQNTRCQRLMRIIYMSGWYSQGWGRGHSVENCVTHWFTGSHNRSFLPHRHTYTHTMQSLLQFHTSPNFSWLLKPW